MDMNQELILKKIKLVRDGKMSLGVINENQLPHKVVRVFFVKSGLNDVRGKHGHKECWQSLICLEGKIRVDIVDHLGNSKKINLETEDDVLIIPPGNWARQIGLDKKNILLVMASELYDENDYFYNHPKINC
jgi:dTDP-4-dehydrorhamnose 3,5-epimerase-like enzyme